jgi:hypothetical protein
MYTQIYSTKNGTLADPSPIRVAAMTVNPYLIHVYWQIPEQDLENISHTRHELPANARAVLRFYDVTCILFDGTNAHHTFDVEVDLLAMKRNVPIWSADKSYVVDLGYKGSDGRFNPIARSNVVNVPRAEPSPRLAERYLQVEGGELNSLVPVRVAHVPHGQFVEAALMETIHGTGRDTEEPSESKAKVERAGHWDWMKHGFGATNMIHRHIPEAEQAERNDLSATKCGSREAGIISRPVPGTGAAEEQGPVRDTSYPFDLVRLTQERFSFGVSSPTGGTDSRGG